jgi:hypothetical protein
MKKVLLVVLLVCGAAALYAADGMPAMMGGLELSYSPIWQTTSFSGKILGTDVAGDSTIGMNALGIGAFFDITYVKVSIAYEMSMGGSSSTVKMTKPTESTVNATDAKSAMSALAIQLLGKYPFAVATGIAIWPALGIEYNMNMSVSYDGKDVKKDMTDDAKNDLNDLYLKAGVGADFAVGDKFVVTPSVLIGMNLTAAPKTTADNTTYSGWEINVGVAGGYKF